MGRSLNPATSLLAETTVTGAPLRELSRHHKSSFASLALLIHVYLELLKIVVFTLRNPSLWEFIVTGITFMLCWVSPNKSTYTFMNPWVFAPNDGDRMGNKQQWDNDYPLTTY